MMFGFEKAALACICLASLAIRFTWCQVDDNRLPYYQVPNPFESPGDGFYSIKSSQTTVSSQRKKGQIEVEEYFSLSEGFTYSLHRNQDKLKQTFAIIGDSARGKSYIVRNPESVDSFDCELAHSHDHKQVFPWQYMYVDGQGKGEKKKFIYGVGAIWLNAIQRKIVSDQVGEDSPYPAANVWLMREGDLEVKLLFDKPTETRSGGDMAKLIAGSRITSIQMRRENVISNDQGSSGTNLVTIETDVILIDEFNSNIRADVPKLAQFKSQLSHCREAMSHHRMFPSLMRALSLSRKRLYGLQYVERKFGHPDERKDGDYDEKLLRHSWRNELVTELFSFREEAQLTAYGGLPENPQDYSSPETDFGDLFIKKFTAEEKQRSTRHATVSYHMFEREGRVESCKVREDEPLPTDHLLVRPIHFVRPHGRRITGRLTGIGALLMNAADVHYKQFNLFKREISVALDHSDPYSEEVLLVDEWQFYDKKSDRTYHFYFRDADQKTNGDHDIKDLVRIDVRDPKVSAEDVIDTEDEDDGLIVRYDVMGVFTELRDSRIKMLLTPAKMCFNLDPPTDSDNNDDDEDDDSDSDDEEFDVSDDEEDGEENEEDHQRDDMEFNPGKMLESFQFPDFFEFLDGQPCYTIQSEIELLSRGPEPGPSRHISLTETVDVERGWTMLSINFPQKSSSSRRPIIYYINYNSEVILRLDGELGACSQVNSVEPWMQLFSAESSYQMTPDEGADEDSSGDLVIESSALRQYGVGALWRHASESVYTDFVGMKKEVINGPKDRKYRELLWSLADDGDHDMVVDFKFLWDLTQWEADKAKHRHRRTIEMIQLDSIYISEMYGDDEEVGTSFKKFKVQITSFEKTESKPMELPVNCRYILDALNANADKDRKGFRGVSMPSILDYMAKVNSHSYSVDYSIKHSLSNHNFSDQTVQVLPVKEYFDGDQNLGKLTIGSGKDTREVFIDGKKKAIFSYALDSNTCKSIKTLKPLVDIGDAFSEANADFSLEKMYGLGALWLQLTNLKRVQLWIKQRHDNSANRYEVRTYEAYQLMAGGTISSLIRTTFVSRPGAKITRNISDLSKSTEEFKLESIEFKSDFHRPRVDATLHNTFIKIDSINSNCPRVWDLPEACKALIPATDEPMPDQSNLQFPKVMNLIKSTQQFHIRAEMTFVEGPARQKAQRRGDFNFFLMDEWLYRRDVRLKTQGLKKNLDLMIYGSTKESFDLSVAYSCPSELPSPDAYQVDSNSNLLQFWNDNTTLVESLSYLYYSPIALWWLAEKAGDEVKLFNSLDIAPKLVSNTYRDYLARDTRSEVWRYTKPGKWIIDFFFSKYSRLSSGKLQEWYVLEKVVLDEPDVAGKIQIEVINYEWNQRRGQYQDLFLLPEGYGCKRTEQVMNDLRKLNDEIKLSTDADYWISYEASLEFYDENGNKTVLPTVSGTYAKSNSLSPLSWDDVSAHFSRVRTNNGKVISTKTVYDTDHSIFYKINRLNGECSRSFIPNLQGKDWIINFPIHSGGAVKTVVMKAKLFTDLFQNTAAKQFVPLNRYTDNGELVTVYENSFSDFQLVDTSSAPTTIIRKFSAPESKIKSIVEGSVTTRLYRSISVKVLLFDKERKHLQAVFSISMPRFSNSAISEIVRLTNVAQCFYDGSTVSDKSTGSFTIEYKAARVSQTELELYKGDAIAHMLVKNLVMYFKVMPTQLNGVPKVNIEAGGIIKIHFSLLEAPTAIEYFRKKSGATMSDEMSVFAEVKLISPLFECSRWCDSMGCIAMSYCNDRTCRVLTPNMIEGDARHSLDLDSSIGSDQCSFFYRSASASTSLQSLTDKLDTLVNGLIAPQGDEFKIALTIEGETMYPIRFYNSRSSFEDIDEGSGLLIGESTGMVDKADEVYKTFKADHRLSIGKLEDLQYTYPLVIHTDTYSGCLDACNLRTCSVMSYCKQDTSCVLIDGLSDLKLIETAIEPADARCAVTVRDFTSHYTKFEHTSFPRTFERELTNYTALECAQMCEAADGQEDQFNCLSFDLCTPRVTKLTKETRELTTPGSRCYLQKKHVMMDEFDRNILEPNYHDWKSSTNTQNLTCDHYSKQTLYDFKRLANRQFNDLTNSPSFRGQSVERCSLDCYRDDKCTAFQYCFDDKLSPAQSCNLLRLPELEASQQNSDLNSILNSLLSTSNTCSVYVVRHSNEDYRLGDDFKSFLPEGWTQILTRQGSFLRYSFFALCYLLGAIIVGSVIQLMYIKIIGRPVTLNCY